MYGCLNLREYGKAQRPNYYDHQAITDTRRYLIHELGGVREEFKDTQIELFANITTSLFHYLQFSAEWVASIKEPPATDLEITKQQYAGKSYPDKVGLLLQHVALFVDEDGFRHTSYESMESSGRGLATSFDAFFGSISDIKLRKWKTSVEACAAYLDRRH